MEEETSEEYEVRVQRETEAADAIQNRRIKRKTETEYSRTYCTVVQKRISRISHRWSDQV